ncbi:MAG: hypothetical protein HN352_07090 [Bacteroidetes bacterium]|jgi:spore coat protein CotH|nr:hypothetical protein [Bacteroidota bacterium]MBT3749020.1 hypothetical protein [Bacteroidota bacterium]MBT4397975.1 hypothetical protein [Bacteroidota bacterium]MBT4411493.1 hypothetical protein [Bacteroidota bacterium]MBT5426852.1 hypothetical protein [Bacteroidota bacterium]
MKMMITFILTLAILSVKPAPAQQTFYNPQDLYDISGGLFDEDSIREIYIEFYDPDYHYVLVNSWYNDSDYRLPAKLFLNGELYDSVAVRYRGNSTFCQPNNGGNPKVPYNIDMNDIVGGQNLFGYKKMKLANAWLDPTFVKEIVSSNVYRKYLPTLEANLIKLNVQGQYLGLYVNLESINKQFLTKHFNESSGVLFKCDRIDRYCGLFNYSGGFIGAHSSANFWTSTTTGVVTAYNRVFHDHTSSIYRGDYGRDDGYSVRCVQDE